MVMSPNSAILQLADMARSREVLNLILNGNVS